MSSDFPYPVMSSDSDDYSQNKIIWSQPDVSESEGLIRISITAQIEDEVISHYVSNGRAAFCALVYCGTTNYRQMLPLEDIEIDRDLLSGTFVVEPSVCALEDIDDYSNDGLSDDYRGISVKIPKGGYLAVGDAFEINIRRDESPDAESICKFSMSPDGREYYDDSDQMIIIYLPEDDYKSFKSLNRSCKTSFTSIHVPPVIQDVIQKYWIDGKDTNGGIWYDVLDQLIRNKYPGEDGIRGYSAYEIMVTIIGQLMSRGSENIYTVYIATEEGYQ